MSEAEKKLRAQRLLRLGDSVWLETNRSRVDDIWRKCLENPTCQEAHSYCLSLADILLAFGLGKRGGDNGNC